MSTALVQPNLASSSLSAVSTSETTPVLPDLSSSLDKAGKKISSRTLRWEMSLFCSFAQALSIHGAFDRAAVEENLLEKRYAEPNAIRFHLSMLPALAGMALLYLPAQALMTLQRTLKQTDETLRRA